MKMPQINLSNLMQGIRRVFIACVCALVLVSYATPAMSAPMGQERGYSGVSSRPNEGEANLTEIERKSLEALPAQPYDLEKTRDEANAGLNEIQGDADKDKMKNPGNTRGVESIEQKVEKALDKAVNKG